MNILKQLPRRVQDQRRKYDFLTIYLRKFDIRYRWLVPEGLAFIWQDKRIRIDSLQDAHDFFETQINQEREEESERRNQEEVQLELRRKVGEVKGKEIMEKDDGVEMGGSGFQMETRLAKKIKNTAKQ